MKANGDVQYGCILSNTEDRVICIAPHRHDCCIRRYMKKPILKCAICNYSSEHEFEFWNEFNWDKGEIYCTTCFNKAARIGLKQLKEEKSNDNSN